MIWSQSPAQSVSSLCGEAESGIKRIVTPRGSAPALTRQDLSRNGAVIVVVSPGSVAQLANLQVGYVIMSVDGKPVKSPMELAAELQNRASGSQVHLGYLFRSGVLGEFTSETTVILGSNK
jgi:S1-C subfamily serine protease